MNPVILRNRYLARYWLEAAIAQAADESDEKLVELLNLIAGGPHPIVRLKSPDIPDDARFELISWRADLHGARPR